MNSCYYSDNSTYNSRALQGGGEWLSGGSSSTTIPDRIDWVELGGVIQVKDQSKCVYSCFLFLFCFNRYDPI